jgi:hypothetical protein
MTETTHPKGYDICGATTRRGTQCERPAGWGTDHPGTGTCKLHLGCTSTQRTHARRIAALRSFGQLVDQCRLDVQGRSTPEAIEDLRERAAATLHALGFRIAALALDPGSEGLYGPDHNHDQRIHVLMVEYRTWLDISLKVEKVAADLGLAERLVRVEEQAGDAIVRVIESVLAELGLGERPEVRELVGRHLRALPSAS